MTNDTTARLDVDSPVGVLTAYASDRGVRAILWPDDDPGRVRTTTASSSPTPTAAQRTILETARVELGEYFAGTRTVFDVPLDPIGTAFQQEAWTALRSIPFGETLSYAEQADRMGDRNKARAVGAANGRNPISIMVPCHRVVGSNGSLTGFAGGLDVKRFLLEHEQRTSGRALF